MHLAFRCLVDRLDIEIQFLFNLKAKTKADEFSALASKGEPFPFQICVLSI